jgi:hypothetical protein
MSSVHERSCVRGEDAGKIHKFGCVHLWLLKRAAGRSGEVSCLRLGRIKPRWAKWRGRNALATHTNKADHAHTSENEDEERRRVRLVGG